jgi:hypothetical protein
MSILGKDGEYLQAQRILRSFDDAQDRPGQRDMDVARVSQGQSRSFAEPQDDKRGELQDDIRGRGFLPMIN